MFYVYIAIFIGTNPLETIKMECYQLESTEDTPKVIFDTKHGLLSMEGRCIPENPSQFFHPITELLEKSIVNSNAKLKVQLLLEYFSTSASRHLLNLLRLLEKKQKDYGLDVHVEWLYREGDEDLKESGEDYASLTGIPFVLKVV